MDRRIENQIIQSLVQGERSLYSLIGSQDASLRELFPIIESMQDRGIIRIAEGRAWLSTEAREKYGHLKPLAITACRECSQTGYTFEGFWSQLLQSLAHWEQKRPIAVEQFDQGFISPSGVVARACFLHERGDLLDSEILLVGDDDLLSLALASTGLPRRIQVLEIDERLVEFIAREAQRLSVPLQVEVFDVQNPLPESFRQAFDVFITDPVETLPGLSLFLSRCVSSLKAAGSGGYFGLTTLEASRQKWYSLQQKLHNMGLVITDIKRGFSLYPQAESSFSRYQEKCPLYSRIGREADTDWYTSSLYRVEAAASPTPEVEGEMILQEEVYRDQESLATPY